MEHWFTHEAADGFNIVPAALPGGLDDFVDLVVPELQRRGLFRTEYEGTHAAREPRPAEAGQSARGAANGKSCIRIWGDRMGMTIKTLSLRAGGISGAGSAGSRRRTTIRPATSA